MRDLGPWRNTDPGPGDDADEMLRRRRLDDRTADAVLRGRTPQTPQDGLADLAAFVAAVRTEATSSTARPNVSLAEVLADGIAPDTGDLQVTAASDIHGPATQVAGPPKRRTRKMLESITTGLAALGLAAKAGIAGATVVAATAGAGAAGILPDAVQVPFDEAVGIERAEVPEVAEADRAETERGVVGPDVAEDARDNGGVDGPGVASDASDGRSDAGRDRAEEAPELPDEVNGRELPAPANGVELPDEADRDQVPDELPTGPGIAPEPPDAPADVPDAPAEPSGEQPGPDDAPPAELPATDAPTRDAGSDRP